jgi:hypothetical protein
MLWVILSCWYSRVLREAGRPRPNSGGCEEMRPLLRILNNFKVRHNPGTYLLPLLASESKPVLWTVLRIHDILV